MIKTLNKKPSTEKIMDMLLILVLVNIRIYLLAPIRESI